MLIPISKRIEVARVGDRFGRLVVMQKVNRKLYRSHVNSRPCFICRCDCGKFKLILAASVVGGGTRSCGCLRREMTRKRMTQHGHAKRSGHSREFNIWMGIKKRCYSQKNPSYKNYGGRGITMCQKWLFSFSAFLRDMGPIPSNRHSIERLDNDRGYDPGNCVWLLRSLQNRNRRTTVWIVVGGERKTLAEWCRKAGIAYGTYYARTRYYGWSVEDAVTTPTKRR